MLDRGNYFFSTKRDKMSNWNSSEKS